MDDKNSAAGGGPIIGTLTVDCIRRPIVGCHADRDGNDLAIRLDMADGSTVALDISVPRPRPLTPCPGS